MPAKKPTYVERIVAWEKQLEYHRSAARLSTPRDAGQIMRDWHKANPYPEPDAPKRKRKVSIKVDEPVAPPAPDSEPEEKPDE